MRGLELRDVVLMSRMMSKTGVKEELKKVAVEANEFNKKEHKPAEKEAFQLRFGVDLMWIVMSAASQNSIESDLYTLISNITGIPADIVPTMDPEDLVKKIKETVDVKAFASFFKKAVQSMFQS